MMGVPHLIQGCRSDVSCRKESIFHVQKFCVPLLILSSKSATYMMDVSIGFKLADQLFLAGERVLYSMSKNSVCCLLIILTSNSSACMNIYVLI